MSELCNGDGNSVRVMYKSGGIFVLADLNQESELDVVSRQGQVSGFADSSGVLEVGVSTCKSSWGYAGPSLRDGDTFSIRLATLNLAGNFSDWGEPQTYTIPRSPPAQDSSGCHQSALAPVGAVCLLLLLPWRTRVGLSRRRSMKTSVE